LEFLRESCVVEDSWWAGARVCEAIIAEISVAPL
jgi:hypothetical protein